MSRNALITVMLVLTTLSLTSCIKNQKHAGYSFDERKVKLIKEEITHKNTVLRNLGSPSTKSSYGSETWYYISNEYETIAFLKPKLKSQKIIAIEFGDNDRVSSIKNLNEEDARKVRISKDHTKTEGSDINAFQQLLGNVGRFNSGPSQRRPGSVGRR